MFCHEQLIDPREISDLAQMFSETAQKYPFRCEALKLIYNDEHQHNSFPGQSLPDKNRFLGRDEVAAVLLVAEQTQSMEIPAACWSSIVLISASLQIPASYLP